jgi:hypothetical protein
MSTVLDPTQRTVAMAALPLLGALALSQGCKRTETVGIAPPIDAGQDTSAILADAGDAGDQQCSIGSVPALSPAGWVQPSCVPSSCRIAIAPDQTNTNAPPAWTSCGSGCLVYRTPGADAYTGMRDVLGASRDGVKYIAFANAQGPQKPVDIQIVRLPDNVVTFNATLPDGFRDCSLYVQALDGAQALIDIFYMAGPTADQVHRYLTYVLPAGQAVPRIVHDRQDKSINGAWCISNRLWAASFAYDTIFFWQGLGYSTTLNPGWTSPDGRVLFGMTAVESFVFFSTLMPGRLYDVDVWDPIGGARRLAGSDAADQGGACCVATDGNQMAWFQGSSWQPDAGNVFGEVWLTTSPFATDAPALKPRQLRKAQKDSLDGGSLIIGGGYALSVESRRGSATGSAILTRLADGAFVTVPPLGDGSVWGQPVYVDAEEIAMFAYPPSATAGPSGRSIVRLSVQNLGALRPADSGLP